MYTITCTSKIVQVSYLLAKTTFCENFQLKEHIFHRAFTFRVLLTGSLTLGSKTSPRGPSRKRKSGFFTYPHSPLALNIPCISQSDLPCPCHCRVKFSSCEPQLIIEDLSPFLKGGKCTCMLNATI